MLMALLLGKRNAIDDEILSAYTKAGVIPRKKNGRQRPDERGPPGMIIEKSSINK